MEKESIEKKKASALKVSIVEGSVNSFSTSISNSYITPFALKLSDKDLYIGILSAISGLFAPLAQLFGSKMMESYSRKKIVLKASLWQAIMWLPLTVIAIMKMYGIQEPALIYYLIIFYSLIAALGGAYYPAWFSWMGDLVSDKEKGKYFSKRNTITGIVELLAVILATALLNYTENKVYALVGFALIFFFSFLFRYISFLILHKQYSPHAKSKEVYKIKISTLIKENKDYRRFAIYQMFFNFAIMIASPFFAVYMLKDLGFSYWNYILVTLSSSVFYLLFTPLIGKISDKYGNVSLLLLANVLFAVNPVLWIFIKNPAALILLPQLVSGLANAASIISFTNFSYDYLNEKERGVGIAYANLLSGIGIFVGSLIGGVLLDYLNIAFINKFIFIFAVSAILRALVALVFLPKIKEKKKVKEIPVMHISLLHPFKSIHSEIGWIKEVVVS